MLKRNSLPVFFVLTFIITWAMWFPAVLTKLNGGASILGPDNPVGQFGRWAPGIAAIILTAFIAGKKGIGDLFRPLKIWQVNIGWYLVALFYQPLLFFFAKWVDGLFGNAYEVVSPLASVNIDVPIIFVIIGVIISAIPGALMEELGWRGFALPKLQSGNTALIASIILGLIWGAWHIPSIIFFGETNALNIIWSVANFIPVTILFTWLYNNTQGSLPLVTIFHASTQYSNNFLGTVSTGTANIVTWLVAIIIMFVFGMNNLSKDSERIQSD
jgi:membrane protease YdiL (CAAX protease family)